MKRSTDSRINPKIITPHNAPVQPLNTQLEQLACGKLYEIPLLKGQKSAANSRALFKVLYTDSCAEFILAGNSWRDCLRIDFR